MRSVRLRGLLNTLRLPVDEIRQERKLGIRTAALKKSASPEFFHYQGSAYAVLQRVFKELVGQTRDYDFVDIGCGKGRAVFVAEHCGYNKLTGIELDEDLLEDARQNAKRYSIQKKESVIAFVHANALDYSYKNIPTVYFLFNPFNRSVLQKVLQKIKSSTTSDTWFIYMNPLFKTVFEEMNSLQVSEFKTERYLEAVVYRWPEI